MERSLLMELLDRGLSLREIGERVGRDPTTVSYWCKKHDLVPPGREVYAPKGGLSREALGALVDEGLSLTQIAQRLEVSPSTVAYWMRRHELQLARCRSSRVAAAAQARAQGLDIVVLRCPVHGDTLFKLYDYGRNRCLRCRAEAVVRRRRKVKRILVDEAGGSCVLCGYDRCPEALEFHHRERSSKSFSVSEGGVTRSLARVRREVAKCVLLCANCHAEVEAGVSEVPVVVGQ